MIKRIKKFFSALAAEVRETENELILSYLTKKEQDLFFQMSIVDQRHALDVCYHVEKSLKKKGYHDKSPEMQLLRKAALLHDVGKRAGELSILDRVIIVLVDRFWPGQVEIWAIEGRGSFFQNRRHACYIAINHSGLGATMLRQINCDSELIDLVAYHHHPEIEDWRVKVLQAADSQR